MKKVMFIMKCPNCSKHISKTDQSCPYCDNTIDNVIQHKRHSHKKGLRIVLVVFSCFLVLGIIVVGLLFVLSNNNILSENECEMIYKNYTALNTVLKEKESKFFNEKGSVEYKDVSVVLSSFEPVLEEWEKDGKIESYTMEEIGTYITLPYGVGYTYDITINDMMDGDKLGEIMTLEPYATSKETIAQYLLGGRSPDKSATEIANTFPNEYSFNQEDNIDRFEIEDINSLENKSIIIWYGHGGYKEKIGSYLGTSVPITDQYTLLKYNLELGNNEIILSKNNFCVSSEFFKSHLEENSLDGAIVYLASCQSGKDGRLADVLCKKGAKSVIANTGIIFTRYNLYMLTDYFTGLLQINNNGERFLASEALQYAKKKNGAVDTLTGTEVIIFKNDEYRITDSKEGKKHKATTQNETTSYLAANSQSDAKNSTSDDKNSSEEDDKKKSRNELEFEYDKDEIDVGTAVFVRCKQDINFSDAEIKTEGDKCFKINIMGDRLDLGAGHYEGEETFIVTTKDGRSGSFTLKTIIRYQPLDNMQDYVTHGVPYHSPETKNMLNIEEINGDNVVFRIDQGSQNRPYITHAEGKIYDGNKVKFEAVDSSGNQYSGFMEFDMYSIYLKLDLTKESQYSSGTMDCDCRLLSIT